MSTPTRRSLSALSALNSEKLYALGLTDAHIALLDAAAFAADAAAAAESDPGESYRLERAAARRAKAAGACTMADVIAVLGYDPREVR